MVRGEFDWLPEKYEGNDMTEVVGWSLLKSNLLKKSSMFKLNWANIKSAIVYGVLTLGLTFLLSASESVIKAGSIFGIDWHAVVDNGAMAVLPVFVTTISIIKNLLTTSEGKFLGVVKVIPPIEE